MAYRSGYVGNAREDVAAGARLARPAALHMLEEAGSWTRTNATTRAAAETEQELSCPYCGETVEITVDPTGGAQQEYVEDCPVCCQPWQVHVEVDSDGRVHVWADAADE